MAESGVWDNEIDWDSSCEWSDRYVSWLLQTLNRDYREHNFSRDFYDKLKLRGIHLSDVRGVINSSETYIARYWYYDSNRVGLWRPRTRLFVAWKPQKGRSPSRFMTVFKKADGIGYMQDFPPFREIRGQRV